MTTHQLPEIAKKAERMLIDIEQVVRGFTRYNKYTLGSDLRAQSMAVVRMCNRTWRDRHRQSHWLTELIWSIDELKLSLQIGMQIKAFQSFPQFESLIRNAEELGRCAGGWKKDIYRKSQNSTAAPLPECAQILSGRAASTSYGGAKE